MEATDVMVVVNGGRRGRRNEKKDANERASTQEVRYRQIPLLSSSHLSVKLSIRLCAMTDGVCVLAAKAIR